MLQKSTIYKAFSIGNFNDKNLRTKTFLKVCIIYSLFVSRSQDTGQYEQRFIYLRGENNTLFKLQEARKVTIIDHCYGMFK